MISVMGAKFFFPCISKLHSVPFQLNGHHLSHYFGTFTHFDHESSIGLPTLGLDQGMSIWLNHIHLAL